MILRHVHLNARLGQKPSGKFAMVDSGLVGISTSSVTPFWSTGFSGCIGLVMCGAGPGGALVHLNQAIQDSSRDLALALEVSARFVCSKMKVDCVTDVLIFYGDPEVNQGQNRSLTSHEIKRLLRCQRVIDLRRGADGQATYGSDFVYVPATQTVYTAANGLALELAGFDDNDALDGSEKPIAYEFPYDSVEEKAKLTPGLGQKGWFQVP
jgi:hypothetical protein